jgi:hypothetical protein
MSDELHYVLGASLAFDEEGKQPMRVCLVKWYEGGRPQKYGVHIETLPSHAPSYLGLGRYYRQRGEAEAEYTARLNRYDTVDDPSAWLPEDVQYDLEDSPQIFRTYPFAQYGSCLWCKHLEEYGTYKMIDVCTVHRERAATMGRLGSQHHRHDPAKIIPRKCQFRERSLVPDTVIELRTRLIKDKLRGKRTLED